MEREDIDKKVATALGGLPTRDEIRQRLAENLQERLKLRKMIRLVGLREQVSASQRQDGGAA
jgi:hypothetical protein